MTRESVRRNQQLEKRPKSSIKGYLQRRAVRSVPETKEEQDVIDSQPTGNEIGTYYSFLNMSLMRETQPSIQRKESNYLEYQSIQVGTVHHTTQACTARSSNGLSTVQHSNEKNNAERAITVIQRMDYSEEESEENKEHEVHEGKYVRLNSSSLGESVVVPNVSGCAAVKIFVYTKGEKEGERRLVETYTFHSDGMPKSQKKAKTIATKLVTGDDNKNKEVDILVITNGHEYNIDRSHVEIINTIKTDLENEKIPCKTRYERLIRKTSTAETINLTGTQEEIGERYASRFGFSEEELEIKRMLFKEYKKLEPKARDKGVFLKKRQVGRRRVNNENYIPQITGSAWAKLEPKDAQKEVTKLENKLNQINTCCIIL